MKPQFLRSAHLFLLVRWYLGFAIFGGIFALMFLLFPWALGFMAGLVTGAVAAALWHRVFPKLSWNRLSSALSHPV
jgi:hypothetical protein